MDRNERRRAWEDPVRAVLEAMAPLPEEEWAFARGLFAESTLERGASLTSVGQVADRFAVVLTGLLRKVHVTEKGRTVVRGFSRAGSFAGAYASLLTGQPSYLAVEAVIPSRLLVLRWPDMLVLYERHVCWQIFGRKVAEAQLLEREERAQDLLTLSASERYERFVAAHRDVLEHLRSADVASYLGITPVSLSRLRGRRGRARMGTG